MSPEDYIKLEVDKLVSTIPSIQCRYEYVSEERLHFIEITPEAIYYTNEEYIQYENELVHRFERLYPDHSLGCVTVNSLYELEGSNYSRKGYLYTLFEEAFANNMADLELLQNHEANACSELSFKGMVSEVLPISEIGDVVVRHSKTMSEEELENLNVPIPLDVELA